MIHNAVMVAIFAVIALVIGFMAAAVATAFLSISSGFSEIGSGFFVLLWLLFAVGLFAWMMSIRERFRMMSNRPGRVGTFRARIEEEKRLAEDPFYEPSPFPFRRGKRKPVIDPSWGVPLPPDEGRAAADGHSRPDADP